ncbi:MAG: methyl-accepting chemotaxis protein, partial [Oscillospiraceae bacterium]
MLKNMKIGKKLILTFVIVAIIASAAGITSIFTTANIDKQYSNALTNFGFAQGDAGKLLASFIRIDGNVHDAISYSSVEHAAEAAKKYGEMVLKMPDLFTNVEHTLLTDTEKQALVKVETAFNNYKKLADELLEEGKTANAGKIVQLQKRLVNELDPIYVEIYDEVQQIFNDKVSRGNVISANVSKLVFIVGLISVVLSVIAVIVAIVLGILVSKSVTKPLQEIEKASLDLSEGKLDIEVDYKSKNELGVVADSFRKFTGNLKFIINDIIGLLNGMSDSDFTVKSQNADAYINSYEPIKVALRKILNDLSSTLLSVNQSAAQVNAGSDQVSGGAQALSQ